MAPSYVKAPLGLSSLSPNEKLEARPPDFYAHRGILPQLRTAVIHAYDFISLLTVRHSLGFSEPEVFGRNDPTHYRLHLL